MHSCCYNMLEMYFSREMTLSYGLWDQIRVDYGKEFYLMLYVQEILAQYRNQFKQSSTLTVNIATGEH